MDTPTIATILAMLLIPLTGWIYNTYFNKRPAQFSLAKINPDKSNSCMYVLKNIGEKTAHNVLIDPGDLIYQSSKRYENILPGGEKQLRIISSWQTESKTIHIEWTSRKTGGKKFTTCLSP